MFTKFRDKTRQFLITWHKMKSINLLTSCNLLAKSISQVIGYFLTNCILFLKKFWMLQVRKSRFCGISDIFFQCCFLSETTQVLMTVSVFLFFSSSRNQFPYPLPPWKTLGSHLILQPKLQCVSTRTDRFFNQD